MNPLKVVLQDMSASDAQDYINLHRIINFENPYMIRPAGEYEIPVEQIESEAIKYRVNRFKYWKILRINDEIAGHVRISRSSKERLKHKAELTIGLIDKFTGAGYGKMMLDDCLNFVAKYFSYGYEVME